MHNRKREQIKQLADEAIALQNKDRMDAALREISALCDLFEGINVFSGARNVENVTYGIAKQFSSEAEMIADIQGQPSPAFPLPRETANDLTEASLEAALAEVKATGEKISFEPSFVTFPVTKERAKKAAK